MSKCAETISELGKEIAELRDGRGRNRSALTRLLQEALDALMASGHESARQAGCRCDEEACKYPLCIANRAAL